MLSWTAISYGVPLYTRPPESEYSPSVFSLTTVISRSFGATSGLFTPRESRAGSKFTYWSNAPNRKQESPEGEMIRHRRPTDGAEVDFIAGCKGIEAVFRHHPPVLQVELTT